MPAETIDGISYLTDAQGRSIAVQIDLDKHRELREDLEEAVATEQRRDEPTITYEEYRIGRGKRGSRRKSRLLSKESLGNQNGG